MLGQLCIGSGLDGNAGTGGNVVQDDGLGGSISNGVEHGHQTLLGGLVVVGGDNQHTVVAQLTGILGHVDGVSGVIGAGASDHGDTASGHFQREAQDFTMLLIGEGGAFAGGAADDQGVDALLDLPVDELLQGGVVHTVGGHGGNQSGGCTAENAVGLHKKILLFVLDLTDGQKKKPMQASAIKKQQAPAGWHNNS